jgi:hypothetical protein
MFATKFAYTLFKKNLVRVSEPKLLSDLAARRFPEGLTLKSVCVFKEGKRTGVGENIKLSVNLRRLAEEGFYEVGASEAVLCIFKKENTLSLVIEGLFQSAQ